MTKLCNISYIATASQNAVSAHFTSEQILPSAFEEQHSAVSAHFTNKQKLPLDFQEYSDPERV